MGRADTLHFCPAAMSGIESHPLTRSERFEVALLLGARTARNSRSHAGAWECRPRRSAAPGRPGRRTRSVPDCIPTRERGNEGDVLVALLLGARGRAELSFPRSRVGTRWKGGRGRTAVCPRSRFGLVSSPRSFPLPSSPPCGAGPPGEADAEHRRLHSHAGTRWKRGRGRTAVCPRSRFGLERPTDARRTRFDRPPDEAPGPLSPKGARCNSPGQRPGGRGGKIK
jgi:hypothetical protein